MNAEPLVLLVDDDEDFRSLLAAGLRRLGYRTHQVENTYQAKKWLASNRPALMILDLIMPEGNGIDFYREIRAESALKDIPVLFLSGIKDAEVTRDAMKLGALDFLYKPSALQSLEEKMNHLMTARKLPKEGS